MRQSRGGSDYDTRFGHRMRGTGTFADLLEQRFRLACRRLGLAAGEASQTRTDLFTPPPAPLPADTPGRDQLDLFASP